MRQNTTALTILGALVQNVQGKCISAFVLTRVRKRISAFLLGLGSATRRCGRNGDYTVTIASRG